MPHRVCSNSAAVNPSSIRLNNNSVPLSGVCGSGSRRVSHAMIHRLGTTRSAGVRLGEGNNKSGAARVNKIRCQRSKNRRAANGGLRVQH